MSDDTPTTNDAETRTPGTASAGGVHEATTHNIGKKIIETLRNTFAGSGKVQCGDLYLHRSRVLLQNNFRLMHPNDQITTLDQLTM